LARGVAALFELRLLIVCATYYVLYRLARRFVGVRAKPESAVELAHREATAPIGPEPPAPSGGELLTLREWAFEYERMVIASETAPAQRERYLYLVSRLIVPLVGHVRVCELDDELVRSVGHVLAVNAREDQARYVARGWAHFVGWVRYYAAPAERRNIWTLLDADVLRVYDEFTDG
jgi:hypothetical protein